MKVVRSDGIEIFYTRKKYLEALCLKGTIKKVVYEIDKLGVYPYGCKGLAKSLEIPLHLVREDIRKLLDYRIIEKFVENEKTYYKVREEIKK